MSYDEIGPYQANFDDLRHLHQPSLGRSQKCAILVRGLDPYIEYRDLLDQIRNTGRIFHIRIIRPHEYGPNDTAQARIVMWDVRSRKNLQIKLDSPEFGYQHPRVRHEYDSYCIPPRPRNISTDSRVIRLKGTYGLVCRDTIYENLSNAEFFYYPVDITDPIQEGESHYITDVIFASYHNLAQTAYGIFGDIYRNKGVTVSFGVDPCVPLEE
ncbi:hypothetical protein F4810DRAFT_609282 [Camillea tinctor]|nr:hypothetical protein F4810DRAFT_609282 [Camillea tinctor]